MCRHVSYSRLINTWLSLEGNKEVKNPHRVLLVNIDMVIFTELSTEIETS